MLKVTSQLPNPGASDGSESNCVTHHKMTSEPEHVFSKFPTLTYIFQRTCSFSNQWKAILLATRNKTLCQWPSIRLWSHSDTCVTGITAAWWKVTLIYFYTFAHELIVQDETPPKTRICYKRLATRKLSSSVYETHACNHIAATTDSASCTVVAPFSIHPAFALD